MGSRAPVACPRPGPRLAVAALWLRLRLRVPGTRVVAVAVVGVVAAVVVEKEEEEEEEGEVAAAGGRLRLRAAPGAAAAAAAAGVRAAGTRAGSRAGASLVSLPLHPDSPDPTLTLSSLNSPNAGMWMTPNAAGSVPGSSLAVYAEMLAAGNGSRATRERGLNAFVFHCNDKTFGECANKGLFGLPRQRMAAMRAGIKVGVLWRGEGGGRGGRQRQRGERERYTEREQKRLTLIPPNHSPTPFSSSTTLAHACSTACSRPWASRGWISVPRRGQDGEFAWHRRRVEQAVYVLRSSGSSPHPPPLPTLLQPHHTPHPTPHPTSPLPHSQGQQRSLAKKRRPLLPPQRL